ncbi:MAG: tetratricopeptide repeat protein [Bacteroidales bacterium]|jgi:tetratricopeptide (TPR) repeat protein|nr:tetratricopeptide repeat protein [Bacteroidales bacterium]
MKDTVKVKYIEELIADEKLEAAIEYLTKELEVEMTADFLIRRGDLYKKLHAFGKALGDYRNALKIDPDNQVADTKVKMIENILSIENTFYYENAYTDEMLFPET